MRVLFTSVPGVGHLHPMLPLAKALLARGDEVLWLTGTGGCERLRHEGIATSDAGLDEADGMSEFHHRFPEVRQLPPQALPDFMFPKLFAAVRAPKMLEDALPVAKDWAPDLLVCDAAELAGPLIAASLRVPNVTHSFGALLPPSRVAAASDEMAPLWRAQGLDPQPFCGCYDHLYLDIYPRTLQAADLGHVGDVQSLRPEGIATQGEPLPDLATADTERPLLYVTLGTVFSNDAVLTAVLDAVADLPVRVVATVGPRGDPDAVGHRPDHVHVAHYIAQQDLLPHCAAVISHGGSGTFLAALAAGLPQLCLPQAADQFLNAAAAETAGCGIALGAGDLSPGTIRQSATRLLDDPTLSTAAKKLRKEIEAMTPPDVVAERLHAAVK